MNSSYEIFDYQYIQPQLREIQKNVEVCNKQILTGITEAMERISTESNEFTKSIFKSFSNPLLNNNFSSIYDFLAECTKIMYVTDISEQKKTTIKANYRHWGEYGCTMPPFADTSCFSDPPQSQKDAEKLILQYCNDFDDNIFELLKEKRGHKKELAEAIECYKQGHWVACATILCSLIDARLINLQGKKNNKKQVGNGAKNFFEDHCKTITANTSPLIIALTYENLFGCLNVLFAKTNNFTLDSKIINRNMLLHGMLKHPVRKIDCIKLFLLLYNLIEAIEIYRIKIIKEKSNACPKPN